jgi:hypothetical protein
MPICFKKQNLEQKHKCTSRARRSEDWVHQIGGPKENDTLFGPVAKIPDAFEYADSTSLLVVVPF